MRRGPINIRFGNKVIEIHLRDAPDGVNKRNRVGPASLSGAGGLGDVGDIWREFDDHRLACDFHYPTGDLFRDIGILTDGRAHPSLAHSVWATEVQLKPIDSRILAAADEVMPMLAGISHQGGNEHAIWPPFFDFLEFTKIRLGRAVADKLNVVKADHALVPKAEGRIPRGYIGSWLANGFPHDAAPSCLKCPVGLIGRVRGWP